MGRRIDPATIAGWCLAAALVLFLVGPILTVIIYAFAEQWRYPNLLPTRWGFRFWNVMLGRADVAEAISISLAIAFTATTLSALICWPAAYAFARLRFPGRQPLLMAFLAAQAFPKFALFIAIAVVFLRFDLVGTFWGVVLVQLVNTLLFMIWIPTAAFRAIPPALEEAALDLGASRLRVFIEVTLPQAAPALAASYILAFVGTLFEVDASLLIGAPTIRPMPILMLSLSAQVVVQHAAVLCVILWVPAFALLLLSRRLMSARTIASGLGA
ncbi:MAG: ABC transporter permease [Rhodospirillales bacterium]|jgi:putative spermidine/putrescine transport system permease protein